MSSGPPPEDACSIVAISLTENPRRESVYLFRRLAKINARKYTTGTFEAVPPVQRSDLQVASWNERMGDQSEGRSGSDQIPRACN
ncbi:hypothetical protein PUN28_006778 [Cardiocondyla obscurior]|uniref:Uncharacterized protein n=1 Tax=Cardiocondyla obscurior TaxID=286306 RepID=A0AAW2G0A1_9HYME